MHQHVLNKTSKRRHSRNRASLPNEAMHADPQPRGEFFRRHFDAHRPRGSGPVMGGVRRLECPAGDLHEQ